MSERITLGADGLLDEVSAGGAYLERMDDGAFFLTMERYDGSAVAIWLYATKKGVLGAHFEERSARPRHLRSLSPTARPVRLAEAKQGRTGAGQGPGMRKETVDE